MLWDVIVLVIGGGEKERDCKHVPNSERILR